MSNFLTMARQVLVQTREVVGNISEVKLAIIDSVTHHQPMRFWFQDGQFTLVTAADKERFPLSEAQMGEAMYLQDDVWVDVDQSTSNRHQVVRVTPSYIDLLRSHESYTSWPEYFAIDGSDLMIWPGTDGVHTLRFRGTKRIPAPRKKWDDTNSAWVFPDGDNFTNEWFTIAERSVREYANYLRLGGENSSTDAAHAALARHLEARADLTLETEGRQAAPRADPWPAVVG